MVREKCLRPQERELPSSILPSQSRAKVRDYMIYIYTHFFGRQESPDKFTKNAYLTQLSPS